MLSHDHRLPGFRIPVLLKIGRRVHSDIATLILVENELNTTRIGILIPVKLSKKAVYRNRSKRLISEAVRQQINNITSGFDVIIMAKKLLKEDKLPTIETPITELLKKAQLL